ncbi:sodium/potassium/calcium exchanger 1 [Scophthalmus maximus]|uniref:sodium/potassium/calcium exchanger 1 n=1 Tax=Scophthalmus maximus TaxID=52904 RepID=UPI001FA81CBB|nr:sodium/potassium/calcium exchanger 1 [Scophthalmus maximus]XP_035477341.2 sodium/potassium/calcium exchanger 1 [Scophthalmus maximus]
MGCRCCRMIKSYIYDPSVAGDARKADAAGSSLYQPHHLPGRAPGGGGGGGGPLGSHDKQKQGFHNLAYSKSNDSTLKLEVDNNHLNQRLHAAPGKELHHQGSALPAEGGLYIIQPDALAPRWTPSQVPVYPNIQEYENQRSHGERGRRPAADEWDGSVDKCAAGGESPSADEIEIDEGVGGTPDYPCDTGDEGSVLSVDIHTSTTSLSSADTRDELRLRKTTDASTMESGISVMRSEEGDDDEEEEEEEEEARNDDDEEEEEEEEEARNDEEEEEVQSVTDSMVAEALAALEAATAGEDFD